MGLKMTHTFAILSLGGMLALVGCSGDDTATTDTSASTSTSTTSESSSTAPTATDPTTSSTDPTTTDPTTTDPTTTDPTTTDPTTTNPTTTESDSSTGGVCGDGVVDDGEECDDGNDENTDGCLNACQLAVCGDGVVYEGVEECDDGNDIDTDACLTACLTAICGDGLLYEGVEECDDGNNENGDGCSAGCTVPSCEDGVNNGAETDVDCGGPDCDGCPLDGACAESSDCAEGQCIDNTCQIPDTCQAILDADPQAASGTYTIDAGGDTSYEVACDMTTDGGGWTILWATSGGDDQQPATGDTEVLNGDPLAYEPYNRDRAFKALLSGLSTEGIVRRQLGDVWIKFDKAPFDATLTMANKHAHFATTLTANNGTSAAGFVGFSNYNIGGGGDFNLSTADGSTCNGNTTMGSDHHSGNYWHLNCGCQRHYLYSYSNQSKDADGSYKVNTGLGTWTATAGCSSTEGNGLALILGVR